MSNTKTPSLISRVLKNAKNTALRWYYDRDLHFRNTENDERFFFSLKSEKKPTGFSAMIRSKNEESKIERCIQSIYNTFDEIVYIDNGSTDSTLQLVKDLKSRIDATDKIKIFEYPFQIARCGAEHAQTDVNSVRSLAYYYNWCLSKASRNFVVKWDADMYLLPSGAEAFRSFMMGLQGSEVLASIPIRTVYIDPQGQAYASDGEVNKELRIFPNRPYVRFHKAESYEILLPRFPIRRIEYRNIDVYEIKDTRENEFGHWTDTNFPTPRKQREWENYNRVFCGEIEKDFTKVSLD